MPFHIGHKLNTGNQYAKNMKHTDEWKKQMSDRLKGNTHGFQKGKPSPRKGKKSKFPAWNKGKKMPQTTGVNNTRWKGGKTRNIHSLFNPEYVAWRKSVFTRDQWKCKTPDENCSKKIQSHHILRWADYPDIRYEISNGITLCNFHHPRKKIDEENLASMYHNLIRNEKLI